MADISIVSDKKFLNKTLQEFKLENIKETNKVWININNPGEKEYKHLKDNFKFHALSLEDCEHKSSRSKIDKHKDHNFIIFTSLSGNSSTEETVSYTSIYIFISKKYIITLHHGKNHSIDHTMKQLKSSPETMEKGTDFILYSIFDHAIDQYFTLTDKMEEKIDYLQDEAMNKPEQDTLNAIMSEKRRLIQLRKTISPQRELLSTLLRMDSCIIEDQYRVYFSDIYDHILRIYDLIDSNQEVLAGCLELYSSQLSNKMNGVMKVLTIITTMMAPLTVVTGIYGMNFDNIPELHMKYGYYGVWVFVVVSICLQLLYLKKKKWL